jgi:hypothetical protein
MWRIYEKKIDPVVNFHRYYDRYLRRPASFMTREFACGRRERGESAKVGIDHGLASSRDARPALYSAALHRAGFAVSAPSGVTIADAAGSSIRIWSALMRWRCS